MAQSSARDIEMAESNGSVDEGRPIEIEYSSISGGDYKTLHGVLREFVAGIISSGGDGPPPDPLVKRIRRSFSEHAPNLREASRNSARDLLRWTREGSPLRALLVISVGTITLLALTGLLVFMMFFLAATFNAIVISALMSLAAAGGFLAMFFACVAAIYIGALSVAIFVVSAVTISTIIAVIVATGWVGFFWVVWMAAKKSVDLTKHSMRVASSAISAYSSSRRDHHDASLKSPLVEPN